MKFPGEKILREGYADGVVVQERQYNNKIYCVTHIDFTTSNQIHDTFENVCKRYNIDMTLVETIKQKENNTMNYQDNKDMQTLLNEADKRSIKQDKHNNREKVDNETRTQVIPGATAKQVKCIVTLNFYYDYPKYEMPDGPYLTKEAAGQLIDFLIKNKDENRRRIEPTSKEFYYPNTCDLDEVALQQAIERFYSRFNRLYARLAQLYPLNKIDVPVDNFWEQTMGIK